MDVKKILLRSLTALLAAATMSVSAQSVPVPPATTQDAACEGGILYTVRSHGESRPVASGTDAASLQQNRRVEVISTCPNEA
jgi:hypothetical protein